MVRVVFLGFGNVNQHLFKTLYKANEIFDIQVFNKNKIDISEKFENIVITNEITEVKDADVYIIGIPDDAIKTFSESLPFQNKLVVHTSGGVAMDVLAEINRKGVFYPLQTFSKDRDVNFNEVPICIEAENSSDLNLLKIIGNKISDKVVEISSEERAKLHLAAVFVNNFVNYLYRVGNDIVSENNLSFELLKPLIVETAKKIETLSPIDAQTGPANRNDLKTIEKHLHLLENSPYKKLYELFTEALKNK